MSFLGLQHSLCLSLLLLSMAFIMRVAWCLSRYAVRACSFILSSSLVLTCSAASWFSLALVASISVMPVLMSAHASITRFMASVMPLQSLASLRPAPDPLVLVLLVRLPLGPEQAAVQWLSAPHLPHAGAPGYPVAALAS